MSGYELPDSLRSKAYYRLVDLVSEGPIEGLVDGLKSIYFDDTPLMSDTGVLNFKGVRTDYRLGTNNQPYVPGFASVENTTSVNVEVKYGTPVVRTFTNSNTNAVRLTIGIPALMYQDKDSGDSLGAYVGMQIDLQTAGGAWVPQVIGYEDKSLSWDGSILSSMYDSGAQFQISVVWTRAYTGRPPGVLTCGYKLQYRALGASTWIDQTTGTVKTHSWKGTDSFQLVLPYGAYEFRVLKLDGAVDGALSLSGSVSVPGYTLTIQGKTTTRYQRDIRIPVDGDGPWSIRVRRTIPDSTSSYLQNKTFLDATTEVIEAKLRYPNSAYFAVSVDASQFTNVPRRSYRLRGLRVKIPSNYDPRQRTYTGAWDGTFKVDWTDNPAWCFYDMLTNSRYGLGGFVPEAQIDKWALYTIGKYCDESVPDGFGNYEPRFTCNLYLQTRADAYKVVNDMASIFRGLVYWASGAITAVQDAPADPAYLYTPANVIDGMFNYVGSSAKTRHTVALVTWNDPDDLYRQKVEYVEDREGIARYGVVTTEVAAFGCTSRGQAHRVGKWLLFTERLQSEIVTFKTGLDGNLCRPGQIIKVADPARSGVRFGGRMTSATTTVIGLDAPVTLVAGQTYKLSTLKSDGTVQESTVTTAAGTTSSLTVSPAFAEMPAVGGIWLLTGTNVDAQYFRVITVVESGPAEFEVSALAHEPGKFDLIENDIALTPRSISTITSKPAPPTGGVISEFLYEAATDLKTMAVFTWTGVENVQSYEVKYRRDSSNWIDLPATSTPGIQINDAQPGNYEVSVVAVNGLGYRSAPLVFTGSVLGKIAPPADVTGLQLQIQTGTGLLSWDAHPDLDVKLGGKIVVRHTTATANAKWGTSVPIAEFPGASTSGAVPLLSGTYLVKALDTSGKYSTNADAIVTNAPNVLQYNAVVTTQQDPAFPGVKSGMTIAAGTLILDGSVQFDDIADVDAMVGSFDGGTVPSGSYAFDTPVDIGGVYSCRLTADLGVVSFDNSNIVDAWTDVDGLTSIDGLLATDDSSVRLYISTTNDDPAGAPSWSPWRLFSVGDYLARGFRFKVGVERGNIETQQVAITRLAVTVDVPDRVEGVNAVVCPSGGMRVSFAAEFFQTPAIAVTAENVATGDYFLLTNKDATGFDVRFYNSSGTGISRTFDWIAKGFGYKS